MSDWILPTLVGVGTVIGFWTILSPRVSGWQLSAASAALLLGFGAVVAMAHTLGQVSVRRQAYVQFYPPDARGWGPYMGECLRRPDGTFCPQERE